MTVQSSSTQFSSKGNSHEIWKIKKERGNHLFVGIQVKIDS